MLMGMIIIVLISPNEIVIFVTSKLIVYWSFQIAPSNI